MSLDATAARQIVTRALATMATGDFQLVVLDEHMTSAQTASSFFYTSDRYLRARAVGDMLAGNGPGLVNRHTGELTFLWTGESIDAQIAEFEAGFES